MLRRAAPRRIKLNGRRVFLRQCSFSRRNFAQGSAAETTAVYIGVFPWRSLSMRLERGGWKNGTRHATQLKKSVRTVAFIAAYSRKTSTCRKDPHSLTKPVRVPKPNPGGLWKTVQMKYYVDNPERNFPSALCTH